MNYLVTGGAGFIGSHLVDRLLASGDAVTVVDNFSTGKETNLPKNKLLKVYSRDICDDLDDVFSAGGFDGVFHLAGLPLVQLSIENPAATAKATVNGTLKLLELSQKYRAHKFIYTSSSAAYGDQKDLPMSEDETPNPISPYGIQKLMGEHYCWFFANVNSLGTIIFRAFSVYGPRQIPNSSYGVIPRFIQAVGRGETITINGDGTQTRDFIFVSDVVDALLASASPKNSFNHGEIFNLGGGKNISINDLANKIIGDKNIQIEHRPALIEQKDTLADISKAKKLLNWEPKVTLDEGLQKTASRIL